MTKPIVIENLDEQSTGLRKAVELAHREQYGEELPSRFGKNRRSAMATIDAGLALQEQEKKTDEKPTVTERATSILPEPSGLPADLTSPEIKGEEVKESKSDARIRQKQEELLGKEEAERLEEEQRRAEQRRKTLIGIGEGLLDQGRETGGNVSGWLARVPTPGSLWFPLALLLIFFFILITYGGHTRLQWAWLVLTGNASFNLGGSGEIAPAQSGDTGQPTSSSQVSTSSAATGSVSASGVPMIGHPF